MDVIVVGAGPAGAATALLLAREGLEVLLLDRQRFPRRKPCGDCISPGANAVLERLGVLDRLHELRPARIAAWRLHSPGGARFLAPYPPGADGRPSSGLALRRDRFDQVLLSAAAAGGVHLRTGIHVVDLLRDPAGRVLGVSARDGGGRRLAIRALLTVGADGLRSVVARRAGLVGRGPRLRKVSLTTHQARCPDLRDSGELHFGDGTVAGLAPIEWDDDGLGAPANLTVVAGARRYGRRIGADADAFVRRTVQSLPALNGRVRLPAAPLALMASGPFDRPTRSAIADGVALVGDAAGYYDPLTGQGMFQALAGAELLAGFAAAALRRGDASAAALRAYARAHRKLTAPARRLQRVLEQVTARPRLADAAFRRMAASPAAAHALAAVTGDLRSPGSLISLRLWLSLLRPVRTRAGEPAP